MSTNKKDDHPQNRSIGIHVYHSPSQPEITGHLGMIPLIVTITPVTSRRIEVVSFHPIHPSYEHQRHEETKLG